MKNLLLLSLCLLLLGCPSSEVVDDAPVEHQASTENPPANSGGGSDGRSFAFQVPGESGKSKISVSAKGEISMGDWSTRLKGSNVEILKGGELAATVKQKETGKWVVRDPEDHKVAKIKSRSDGGFKVVGPDEKLVAKLKLKDDGFKVVDSDEKTVIIKVKRKEGRVKVKDGEGDEMAKIKGTENTLFVTWMSLEKLPLPVRLGMATVTWRDTDGNL